MYKEYELMKVLEGCEYTAYRCTSGFVTVGVAEDFDSVYEGESTISDDTAEALFEDIWSKCEMSARNRCKELKLNYDGMPEYKRFVLKDIVYNTGSISNWYKVLVNTDPRDVMYEARRNPKRVMDSRVAKISYHYGICKDLDDCIALGLEYAKYIK